MKVSNVNPKLKVQQKSTHDALTTTDIIGYHEIPVKENRFINNIIII